MGSFITISITGYIGSEPQLRQVNDQPVASFSLAVNRTTRSGQQQTLWVRVSCWNKLADVALQYVQKGSLVQVTTEWLRPSAWINREGAPQASLDIDATRLILLDRPSPDDDSDASNDENIPF